jgi:mitochondrial fission protein ELM1
MNDMMNIWVLTEGIAGTENQCLGVAEALQRNLSMPIKITTYRLQLKQPWKTLLPYIGYVGERIYDMRATNEIPNAPWPALVIASGRKAIATALHIKKQSHGKTSVVNLQDPRWAAKRFDLVAVPFHDKYRGKNALVTHGAPNRVTVQKLNAESTKWSPPKAWGVDKATDKEDHKRETVAFLIGGKSKAYDFTGSTTGEIITMINRLAQEKYNVMVTASRRTGAENYAALRAAFSDAPHIYFWGGEGYNPYFSYLAHADHIIVTPDSASMLSEAASTGKAVYCLALQGGNAKFKRFHRHMVDIGAVKMLSLGSSILNFSPRMILNDAALVAEKISALIAEKQG